MTKLALLQQMGNSPLFMRQSHVASAISPLLTALNESISDDEEYDYAKDRQPRVIARWYRHPEYEHVGVLPINDVIYHGDRDYYYYGQSYSSILANMQSMNADESISVMTQVHRCYGGTAAGCGTTSTALSQLRQSTNKPILALSDEAMYSASMYVAAGSAGENIYVTPSAGNASIGTIIPHMEFSEMLKKEGINFTAIRSGDQKATGGQYEKLTKEVEAEMQEEVTKLGNQFIEFVADNMNLSVDEVRGLEGGTLMGEDSKAAGFAKDVVQTTDEFFQIAADAARPKTTNITFTNQQDQTMSGGNKAPAPAGEVAAMEYTPEQIKQIETDAENRLLAKQEAERKEQEAEAQRKEAESIKRENEIKNSDAAKGKSDEDLNSVIANHEDFPTAKSAIAALSLAAPKESTESTFRAEVGRKENNVDVGQGEQDDPEKHSKEGGVDMNAAFEQAKAYAASEFESAGFSAEEAMKMAEEKVSLAQSMAQ